MTRDRFGIINENGERELTLRKICDIMEISVPEELKKIENRKVDNIATRLRDVTKDCIYFRMTKGGIVQNHLEEFVPKVVSGGAAVIFIDKDQYEKELSSNVKIKIPIICVENINEKVCRFYSYIRELNEVKTIAVTGTCGKTTTMNLIRNIIPKSFNTFMNSGNANSTMAVANHILHKLSPENDVYIQEAGAADIDSLRRTAAMLRPDAFVLLNVFEHHLNDYHTHDNLFRDKTSFDDYLQEEGVVITNFDDPKIAAHTFKHKVISFGIDTELKVDYRAVNIVQNEEHLEMDIVFDDKVEHIEISILGTQNAYNVLAAFALCRWMGVKTKRIINGLKKYESSGNRQNFMKVGGYNLLLDCYNVCEDSLKADLETVKNMKTTGNGKKIAVLSGENRLGPEAEKISYNLGKTLDLEEIDHVICVGVAEETEENLYNICHTRPLYESIRETGFENVVYVTDNYKLEEELRKIIEPGDIILFKGMYNLDFTMAVDRIFGTGLSMGNPYYKKSAKRVRSLKYEGSKVNLIEGLDLVSVKNNSKNVKIPSKIWGKPIFRIKPDLFKNNKRMETLDLGKTVVNIGRRAFLGCDGLKSVKIPSNVKVIEREAFSNCLSLENVIIEDGVTHIDKSAFSKCVNLKTINIPGSVGYIDSTAFDGCGNLVIYCSKKCLARKNIENFNVVYTD